jgi:hypothetical protein
VPSCSERGEGEVGIGELNHEMTELPGVIESGMLGKNGQRKPGTTRGSPRRSRTAKASRISRQAAKSRCACEWDGWGRLSDDGSGQNNPDPSEDPWGSGEPTNGGAQSSPQARLRAVPFAEVTRRAKDGRKPYADQRMPGAGLS